MKKRAMVKNNLNERHQSDERQSRNHQTLQTFGKIFKPGETVTQRVVFSSIWLSLFQIFNKGLKFVRTIILARLLSPKEFGLFGIALLALAILEDFTQTGFPKALIQKKGNAKEYLDQAWTIQVIKGAGLAIILFLTAPFLAEFFEEPGVKLLIQLLGISIFLKGVKNIGVIYFQKELEFQKQFLYDFSETIGEIIVTIPLAYIFRNVWALLIGYLTGDLIHLFMSFLLHPYRPKFEWDQRKFHELFRFGKWVLAASLTSFLCVHGDDTFVGKVLGATALGLYQLAFQISNVTAKELTHVINKITFPAYSKVQDDKPRLRKAYFTTLEFTFFVSVPVAVCFFLLGGDFTRIFLGQKWMPIIVSLQILAISGCLRSIISTGGPLFNAVFRPHLVSGLNMVRVIIMVITIYPLTMHYGIAGTSCSVLLGVIATIPVWWFKTCEILEVKSRLIFNQFMTFLPVTLILSLEIIFLKRFFSPVNVVKFVLIAGIAGFSYFGYFIVLWKGYHFGPIKSMQMIKQSL